MTKRDTGASGRATAQAGKKPRSAFLTGLTGQDDSYLAELLLVYGYEVHTILRRSSVFTTPRIDRILDHERLHTYHGDLADSSNLHRLISGIAPSEIYNLGAQSHVGVSFEVPEYTAEVSGIGTVRLLDAIRDSKVECRFYQASTSEIFGAFRAPNRRTNRRRSTRNHPMARPSYTAIGSR